MQARMNHPVFVLPDAMQALLALGKATEGKLTPRIAKLVHLRASQINGCSVCVDMHAKELRHAGVPEEHVFAVAAWRETPFFNESERAALELTEALTRLADKPDPVPDAMWERAAKLFSQDDMAALLLHIAMINVWNRLNAAVKQPVGVWREKAA